MGCLVVVCCGFDLGFRFFGCVVFDVVVVYLWCGVGGDFWLIGG